MTNLYGIGPTGLAATGARDVVVTIAPSNWSNNTCTIPVTGMSPELIAIIGPAPESITNYNESGVICTSQGIDSLTFTCTSTPSTNLTINVVIIESVPKLVSGIIYYIDDSADGTYTFYDANGTRTSAPTVGTDCTGWKYTVTGATKDKYYVYNPNAMIKCDRSGTELDPYLSWTYLDENNQSYIDNTIYTSGLPSSKQEYEYYGYYGRVYESLNSLTSYLIGYGKSNTAKMSLLRNRAYIQTSRITHRGLSTYCETIWYACSSFNKGSYSLNGVNIPNNTGSNDWYIPSRNELELMKNNIGANNLASMLTDSTDSRWIYAVSSSNSDSSAVSGCQIWTYRKNMSDAMGSTNKVGNENFAIALSRSF